LVQKKNSAGVRAAFRKAGEKEIVVAEKSKSIVVRRKGLET